MRGAFVVQLRRVTHGSQLEGVVEEVDTGTQFKFSSENELIEFLRQRFAHTHQSDQHKEEPTNPGTTVVDRASPLPDLTSLVHDLRNPLSAIHGSAEVLISGSLSESQVHRIARNLYTASTRMKELLDEVLTRSRGTNRTVEPCDLRELASSAVDKVALVAEAQSVQIVQRVPNNLVIILDRQRIQRVLVNLFVNALDVMTGGGTIRLSAIPERRSVLIRVRDTGPGIAPELRDRLFQPFATAGKVGGLGLGLYFSRQAVIDHGGQMWVESGGHGTCFAFRLPAILNAVLPHADAPCSKRRRTG